MRRMKKTRLILAAVLILIMLTNSGCLWFVNVPQTQPQPPQANLADYGDAPDLSDVEIRRS